MPKKKNKGITLIALIITIIVLLILAGITIGMLTSNNSILKQSTEAKKATNSQKELEQVRLAVYAAIADEIESDEIVKEKLENELKLYFSNYTVTEVTNGWKYEGEESTYYISKKGEVTNYEEQDIDVVQDYFVGKEWADPYWNPNDGMLYLLAYDNSNIKNVDIRQTSNGYDVYVEYKSNIYKLIVRSKEVNYENILICESVENVNIPANIGIINGQLITAAGLTYDNYSVGSSSDEWKYHGWYDSWDFYYDSSYVIMYVSPYDP